jgi:hypothetical protein
MHSRRLLISDLPACHMCPCRLVNPRLWTSKTPVLLRRVTLRALAKPARHAQLRLRLHRVSVNTLMVLLAAALRPPVTRPSSTLIRAARMRARRIARTFKLWRWSGWSGLKICSKLSAPPANRDLPLSSVIFLINEGIEIELWRGFFYFCLKNEWGF